MQIMQCMHVPVQDYIMIDAIAVLSLGYSMTLSHPAK